MSLAPFRSPSPKRSSPLVTNIGAFPCAAHGSKRGRTSPRCRIAVPWSWSLALLLSRCTGTSADSSLSRGRTSPLSLRTTVLAIALPAPGWLRRGDSSLSTSRTAAPVFSERLPLLWRGGGGGGGGGFTTGGPIPWASCAAALAAWKAADRALARVTLPGLFRGKSSLSLQALSRAACLIS